MEKFVCDSAEKTSTDKVDFFSFVRKRDEDSVWLDANLSTLKFKGMENVPMFVPMLAQGMNVNKETVSDTLVGTALTLLVPEAGGKVFPVGTSAVKSILDRTGLGTSGYERLSKRDRRGLEDVLNILSASNAGTGKIKVADEKVRAIHSGRYASISASEIADMADDYFKQNWPNAMFEHGYYSHELVQWVWNLSQYQAQFMSILPAGVLCNFEPMLVIESSDIALSAVSVRPCLKNGRSVIPMTRKIATTHIGGENICQRVEASFEAIYATFQQALSNVNNLKDVHVRNGKNALLRVLKKNGMPKEQSYEAADIYEQMFGSGSSNALDIYLAVCDAYAFVCRDTSSQKKCFDAADATSRVIYTRWADVDLPGNFDW
ncbi:MAG: hypothetical protein RR415_09360 [Ruthenibacterium sp.]